ncbi:MAG: hypothetical protein M1821_002559 [Bathelium mastoideum]|nr:MAG: hypothetical protein M1821_002559 [Bathelium mastoideum]
MLLPYTVLIFITVWFIRNVRERVIRVQGARRHGCKDPPKFPYKDPILGLDLFFLYKKAHQEGRFAATLFEHFRKYGKTYEEVTIGKRAIITMDPKNIQAVATQIHNFGMEPSRAAFTPTRNFIGRGILTTDGAYWEHSRAVIKPTFAKTQIANLATFGQHFEKMMEYVPKDGSTVDLQELLKRLYLDTATEFVFGESSDLLSSGTESSPDTFIKAFDMAMIRLGQRIRLGKLWFFAGERKNFDQDVARVHAYVDTYVNRALQHTTEHPNRKDDCSSTTYILAREMGKEVFDKVELRHQLLNVFFPARDTIAIAVSIIFFHLARYPEVYKRLRDEVLSIADRELTFELFKSMTYFRQVFNESLRLQLPASGVDRTVLNDCVLPRGGGTDGDHPIFLRKGDWVHTSMYSMHRDPDIWGPDADVFRPERWETARPQWEYIPFFGGPRICPAQQMAFTQSAFVVVKLLERFGSLENRDPEWRYVEENKVTLESRNGCLVGLMPAV